MLHMLDLLLILNLLITIYAALNAKAYLEPCTNVYDGVFSAKNSSRISADNYFGEKTPS